MYAALGIIAAMGLLLVYVMRKARKDGRNETEAEYKDEVIENVKKIKAARDTITDDERKRLRERYGIK